MLIVLQESLGHHVTKRFSERHFPRGRQTIQPPHQPQRHQAQVPLNSGNRYRPHQGGERLQPLPPPPPPPPRSQRRVQAPVHWQQQLPVKINANSFWNEDRYIKIVNFLQQPQGPPRSKLQPLYPSKSQHSHPRISLTENGNPKNMGKNS